MNKRKTVSMIMLLTLVLIGILMCNRVIEEKRARALEIPGIYELHADTEDSVIHLYWDVRFAQSDMKIKLNISDGETSSDVILDATTDFYSLEDGLHGKLYHFSLQLLNGNVGQGDVSEVDAMFLEFERMGNLPILMIDTDDGTDPTSKFKKAPEGLMGGVASENPYEAGTMKMICNGESIYDGKLQIRVRGNVSSQGSKKPYRMVLEHGTDLLSRGESGYAQSEWILLRDAQNLKTTAGAIVSEICGMEWTPQHQFVNLILNGDYKGSYILIEAVNREEGRMDVEDNGFIIENDTYWWAEGGVYFKTDYSEERMGYTFTYPDEDDISQGRLDQIRKYVIDFETKLFTGDESFLDYIDEQCFVNWIMAQDVLGTNDGLGTNMFLYMKEFDADNPMAYQMKIGPVWDMSSAYGFQNQWCSIHDVDTFHYPELFSYDVFRKLYKDTWKTVSPRLLQEVTERLDEYEVKYGDALEESWRLNTVRWNKKVIPVWNECRDATLQQIAIQTDWIGSQVEGW